MGIPAKMCPPRDKGLIVKSVCPSRLHNYVYSIWVYDVGAYWKYT